MNARFLDIRLPAVVLSLLISAWITYSTDVINNDGILYLSAAKLVSGGSWGAACQLSELHCWLLFPVLISLTGKLTTLSLENSAYLLDAVLSGLMVYMFLTLARELGASRRTLLFAAFVILLHPYLNESRADIIRDHGYWLFYLTAILFFVRYWRYPGWRQAFAWTSAAAVATLFRIEGLVFSLTLPLVLAVDTSKCVNERMLLMLKASAFTAVLVTGLLGWLMLDPALSLDQTGRLLEPVTRMTEIWEQLDTGMKDKAEVIGDEVLGKHLDHYALKALWSMLGMIILFKIFSMHTPVYSLLLLFKRFRIRFNPPAGLARVIVWLIILNLVVLLVELLTRYVLSGRFAAPLVLVLMLVVPFALDALYDQWQLRDSYPWQKWLLYPVVIAALLFMSVDGLYSTGKGSKTYLREAGFWLQERVTPATRVFSNNDRVTYYSGMDIDWGRRPGGRWTKEMLKRGGWRKYDYVAIHVGYGDLTLREQIENSLGMPDETFSNSKQDSVLIFRIMNEAGDVS